MISRKIDKVIEQFYATSKNALFLTGARQVGKSFAIRKYAKAHYSVYLELNFYKDKTLRGLVETAPDAILNTASSKPLSYATRTCT